MDNLSLRIIEQQKPDTIFVGNYRPNKPLSKNYQPNLPVAFFIEKVGMFASSIESTNGYAFYFWGTKDKELPIGNFIGLRDPASFTPFFQAVNFFHEARHALDHKQQPNYLFLSNNQREGSAHFVELTIMQHYGGRSLMRIASKHAERIKKKTGFSIEKCGKDVIRQHITKYDDELDRIFGKALSDREKNLRMDRLMFGFACNPMMSHLKK